MEEEEEEEEEAMVVVRRKDSLAFAKRCDGTRDVVRPFWLS